MKGEKTTMSRKFGILLFLFGIFMTPPGAYAGHPLVTDDAGTAGKGGIQFEMGVSFVHDRNQTDATTTVKTEGGEAALVVTAGLHDTVDAVVSLPYVWFAMDENDTRIARADGLSDIQLDLKWRFFEHDGWAAAIKAGLRLPSGDENSGLGRGRTGTRLFFIATREWTPMALHLNLGYTRNENNMDEHRDLWHASLAAEYEIVGGLKLLANIGAERTPVANSENHPAFALGGLSYNLSKHITLDGGVKFGLTSPEIDVTYLTGVTVKF